MYTHFMQNTTEINKLFKSLEKIFITYSQIEQCAIDFGVGTNLHSAEIHMISTVHRMGGASITELAQETGVTKGAVSMLVKKLTHKGMLQKEEDPENRSRIIVSTTGLGAKASEGHQRYHADHDQEFLDYLKSLDDHSFKAVAEFGKQMGIWLEQYLDDCR